MSNKETVRYVISGTPFLSLLTILFIGLKLTGHIDWSWWWVLSPLWIPFATFMGIFLIIFLCFVVSLLFIGTHGIKITKNRKLPK